MTVARLSFTLCVLGVVSVLCQFHVVSAQNGRANLANPRRQQQKQLDDELVMVLEVCRHGDRAPLAFFDPTEDEKHWPGGEGALTLTGVEQHRELGSQLAQRYQGTVLSGVDFTTFNNILYLRSSDYTRTLMSGQAQIQGLLQSLNNQSFPFPIHTVPQDEDDVIKVDIAMNWCPKLYKDFIAQQKTELWVSELQKYAPLLQQLSTVFNINLVNASVDDIYSTFHNVWDYVYAYDANNFTLPFSLTSDQIMQINTLFYWINNASYSGYESNRLTSGGWFKNILTKINDTISGNATYKYVLYSGHDSTIAGILSTFGLFNGVNPRYASHILIEVYNSTQLGYYLKIFYNFEQIIPQNGCDLSGICLLSNFTNFYSQYMPHSLDSWLTECGVISDDKHDKVVRLVLIVSNSITAVVVIVLMSVIYAIRKNTYAQIQN